MEIVAGSRRQKRHSIDFFSYFFLTVTQALNRAEHQTMAGYLCVVVLIGGHTCRGGGKECFDEADRDVKFNKTKIEIDSCSLFHQVKSAKCLLTSEDKLRIQTNSFVPLGSGLKILRVAEAGQSQFKSENGKEEQCGNVYIISAFRLSFHTDWSPQKPAARPLS